jgi:hypothetical protein
LYFENLARLIGAQSGSSKVTPQALLRSSRIQSIVDRIRARKPLTGLPWALRISDPMVPRLIRAAGRQWFWMPKAVAEAALDLAKQAAKARADESPNYGPSDFYGAMRVLMGVIAVSMGQPATSRITKEEVTELLYENTAGPNHAYLQINNIQAVSRSIETIIKNPITRDLIERVPDGSIRLNVGIAKTLGFPHDCHPISTVLLKNSHITHFHIFSFLSFFSARLIANSELRISLRDLLESCALAYLLNESVTMRRVIGTCTARLVEIQRAGLISITVDTTSNLFQTGTHLNLSDTLIVRAVSRAYSATSMQLIPAV